MNKVCVCLLATLGVVMADWRPSEGLGFFEEWPSNQVHQVGENYWLGWHVDQATPGVPDDARVVTLAFAANTLGWVGFGLSANGGMKGADMVIIRGENGQFDATSMSSTEYRSPIQDAEQPWKLVEWNQMNGESYFVVQRRVGGCTENLVNLKFEDLEQRYIVAYGDTQLFTYHTVERRYSLQLNVFKEDAVASPPDLPYWDIEMPGYEVPLSLDSFICANMTFPVSDVKYHIVAVEPLIRHKAAHHFVAWHCPNGVPVPDNPTPEGAWECLDMSTMMDCEIMPIIWTQGQPLYTLASNVGIPFGKDGAQNIVIQMHNNNPDFESGILDTSGLRLYYTDELKEFDAGVMIFGNQADPAAIVLPPGQEEISLTNNCPEDCMKTENPVMVFSFHYHMHQIGRSASLHHIRNGEEIREFRMEHWDYNWQGFFEIEPFEILPGDRVYTECVYTTTSRNETTFGGDGTQDEMCFFYLSIYPAGVGSCIGLEMPPGDGTHTTVCPSGGVETVRFEEYKPLEKDDFCVM